MTKLEFWWLRFPILPLGYFARDDKAAGQTNKDADMSNRIGDLNVTDDPDKFVEAINDLHQRLNDAIVVWLEGRNGDDIPTETDMAVISIVLDSLVAGQCRGIVHVMGYPEEVSDRVMDVMAGKVAASIERTTQNAIRRYLRERN